MPRVSGIDRKKKKNKTAAEVVVGVEAAAEGEVPDIEAQREKRTRPSRKKAPPRPPPLQPFVHTTGAANSWQDKVDELGMEEMELDEELELRLNEVVACKRRLARQQERLITAQGRAGVEDLRAQGAVRGSEARERRQLASLRLRLRLRVQLRRAAHSTRDDGARCGFEGVGSVFRKKCCMFGRSYL